MDGACAKHIRLGQLLMCRTGLPDSSFASRRNSSIRHWCLLRAARVSLEQAITCTRTGGLSKRNLPRLRKSRGYCAGTFAPMCVGIAKRLPLEPSLYFNAEGEIISISDVGRSSQLTDSRAADFRARDDLGAGAVTSPVRRAECANVPERTLR